MAKYVLFLAAIWVTACTTDPLEVREIETRETAPTDDLEAVEVNPSTEGWTTAEDGLTASAPATLELLPAQEALTVSFSYRAGADTRATLLLGNRFPLELTTMDLPGAEEKRSTVTSAPGVWRDVEIAYLPARGEEPPLLVSAYLNNNLVYYQQPLAGETGGTEGPLTLEVTEGTISIANLRSSERAGRGSSITSTGEVALNLPLIRYAYYHINGNPDRIDNWATLTPEKEGYISRFDLDGIREKGNAYAIRFAAEVDIPKAGEYRFRIASPSSTRLYIDDQVVVDMESRDSGNNGEGKIQLSEGPHRVRLDHYQFSNWNHLKVRYAFEDGAFNSFSDIPEDRAVATPMSGTVREIATDDRPYLLRSFMNFPPVRVYDFTEKRTHVISVGEADGPHYSYDLHNGSLLQMWRGKFVDVSDMWNGRGEPQVARALGAVVAFDGHPQWSTDTDEWPDSIAELRHLRYDLDESGRPTFHYDLEGSAVSDRIVPDATGLTRTLTNTGEGTSLLTQLASGRDIRETGPGTFEVQGPGVSLEVTELAAGGLRIYRGEGVSRLVAELPAGEQLTYHINF
ncbi:hypothetical protein GGR28_000468 [Lewinella aquimaris]|uniref:PA14 domain-containing protein n=1 Tax=Neolewinella aquimaris TaxID=1835722 RepID=A0A840E447_9BACT|nr:PA14 domain-containing protein [Neolewinella aquimaris]MBB4077867.1 hypothetical protein [Neolewinella aquimaris]